MVHWQDRNEQWHSCHSRATRARRDDAGMKIEILLFDGFDDLDAFGPFEVLTGAGLRPAFVTDRAAPSRSRSAHGARSSRTACSATPTWCSSPAAAGTTAPARAPTPRRAAASSRRRSPRATPRAAGSARSAPARCCSPRRACSSGRPAITHHSAIEDLEAFGADVDEGARVVDDGDIITAAGVTSGIDLAPAPRRARARRPRRRRPRRRDRAPRDRDAVRRGQITRLGAWPRSS